MTFKYPVRFCRSRRHFQVLGFALCLFTSGLYIFRELTYGRKERIPLDEIQRIWEWEIGSGHYQTSRNLSNMITFNGPLFNPGIPASNLHNSNSQNKNIGTGLPRKYLTMQSLSPSTAYPSRPNPGSIADLDIIIDNCDFSNNKYVKDCLEFLSVGAGLHNGPQLHRPTIDAWKYIYGEDEQTLTIPAPLTRPHPLYTTIHRQPFNSETPQFPPLRPYLTSSQLALACDPEHPRIFHIFWGGSFTSHPYSMILSFIYTQNLGLHLPPDSSDRRACRPELWVWIQTGPAHEANPQPNALELMEEELKTNPWSLPFLHPRFKDMIKFKLWNTTEQLDSIPELKREWRPLNLFKSGGRVFHIPPEERQNNTSRWLLWEKVGPAFKSYDRMRTILSDLARFVLCHRFGGIYLDTDTLLLRDWEELWGWKGAFSYRWSRLPRYNTAVLKLNKGSALGSSLIRLALRNGLDFHPEKITNYIKDAEMENLLFRLPDALFDPAWLNAENFQRDRPPFPYLQTFTAFFKTHVQSHGVRGAGIEEFFRGAYSYHWHNNWGLPFDVRRNWPELGPRFEDAERIGRLKALELLPLDETEEFDFWKGLDWKRENPDKNADLDWSTQVKRTFEAYIRGERPNMYGEWLYWW